DDAALRLGEVAHMRRRWREAGERLKFTGVQANDRRPLFQHLSRQREARRGGIDEDRTERDAHPGLRDRGERERKRGAALGIERAEIDEERTGARDETLD